MKKVNGGVPPPRAGANQSPQVLNRSAAETRSNTDASPVDAGATSGAKKRCGNADAYSSRAGLVGEYAGVIVKALQSEGLLATAKHFIGDGGTDRGIDQGDTNVSLETLLEVHGQGYYSALDAGVTSVMASFNSWNGSKIHGDKTLLNDVKNAEDGAII